MSDRPSYWWAAFNAKPLGMPIPPNWFGVAAFGLLGALVNPGLWLIGLGLEGLYLWSVSRNPRFRNTVDAAAGFVGDDSTFSPNFAVNAPRIWSFDSPRASRSATSFLIGSPDPHWMWLHECTVSPQPH